MGELLFLPDYGEQRQRIQQALAKVSSMEMELDIEVQLPDNVISFPSYPEGDNAA